MSRARDQREEIERERDDIDHEQEEEEQGSEDSEDLDEDSEDRGDPDDDRDSDDEEWEPERARRTIRNLRSQEKELSRRNRELERENKKFKRSRQSHDQQLQSDIKERDERIGELEGDNQKLLSRARRSEFIERIGVPNAKWAWKALDDIDVTPEFDENHRLKSHVNQLMGLVEEDGYDPSAHAAPRRLRKRLRGARDTQGQRSSSMSPRRRWTPFQCST